jgi:hypothetical protein
MDGEWTAGVQLRLPGSCPFQSGACCSPARPQPGPCDPPWPTHNPALPPPRQLLRHLRRVLLGRVRRLRLQRPRPHRRGPLRCRQRGAHPVRQGQPRRRRHPRCQEACRQVPAPAQEDRRQEGVPPSSLPAGCTLRALRPRRDICPPRRSAHAAPGGAGWVGAAGGRAADNAGAPAAPAAAAAAAAAATTINAVLWSSASSGPPPCPHTCLLPPAPPKAWTTCPSPPPPSTT